MQKRTHQCSRRRHGRHTAPPSSRKPGPPLRESTLIHARQALIDYLKLMAPHFDRAEQRFWSAFYLCGQLSDLERKTIEPMVLNLLGVHPEAIRAVQQFIGQSPWAYQPLIRQLEVLVADWLGESDGVLIVDGSGFPKRGEHSAGVAWQYCGRLGKVDNCQVGVFLVYASAKGQAFLNGQLYVPEQWFTPEYASRWKQCGLPPNLAFRTEPEIALALIQQVVEHNRVPFQWVLADEGFGRNPGFLDGLDSLGKRYLVEVPKDTRVWLRTPGVEPPGPSLTGRLRLHPRVVRSAPPPR